MTETNKSDPNSQDEQPDKTQEEAAMQQSSHRRAEQRSSASSADSDFSPVNDQDFLVTFKNLLFKAESDNQLAEPSALTEDSDYNIEPQDQVEQPKSSANESTGASSGGTASHLAKREMAAGQLEERILHGGQIKQVVDRVTGTVTTSIEIGPIEAIIHRPGLPPEITVRDAGAASKLVKDSTDGLAIAEARGKGKTVTIFSDGRVEIRPTHDEQQVPFTEARAKLIIEYPPHHASGLVGRTEYEPNRDGKTILFITRDGAGEITETTTYLGREDGIILTTQKTTLDGRITSTQVYANGTKVTADETGLHIEEPETDYIDDHAAANFAADAETQIPPRVQPNEAASNTSVHENFGELTGELTEELTENLDEEVFEEIEGDVLEALLGTDEEMKLAAAGSLLSPGNTEEVLRWMALDFVTQLQSSRTQASRAAAQAILNRLSKNDAKIALRHLAQVMPARSRSEAGPANRKALNAVPLLFNKTRDDSEAEASVYRLIEFIERLNDKKLTNSVKNALDRTPPNCSLSALQSKDDPRIASMIDVLTMDFVDQAFKFGAAIALADTRAVGVDPSVKEIAKKIVYQSLDKMIERALRFENDHEIAKCQNAWRQIDAVLEHIGENEENEENKENKKGFGRNYVKTRRFDLEGRRIQGEF